VELSCTDKKNKWQFLAELTGYQTLEDWKSTRDHQPVHFPTAFANFSAYSLFADQQDVIKLSIFIISLNVF